MNNYLDNIPVQNASYRNEEGETILLAENKGIIYRILRRPKVSYIHLDSLGSYVWQLIDGEKSVADIGVPVKDRFGDVCEPLYPRLTAFIKILEQNNFIKLKKL